MHKPMETTFVVKVEVRNLIQNSLLCFCYSDCVLVYRQDNYTVEDRHSTLFHLVSFPDHFSPHRKKLVSTYSVFIPSGCKNCDVTFVRM